MMQTIIQAILVFILCSFSATTVFAKTKGNVVTRGFYLGVESGASFVDYKNNFVPGYTARSVTTSGFANRIVAGFDITKNIGAIFSVIYFRKPEFHDINNNPHQSSKIKNNLIFIAAKGMIPIGHRFVININGGFGYIARSQVVLDNRIVLRSRGIVRPVYGLGVAYLVWKRWALTATWIEAPKKANEHLPRSDYIGGGIRYKFAG